jgi:minor extracellular serine protease Vpr
MKPKLMNLRIQTILSLVLVLISSILLLAQPQQSSKQSIQIPQETKSLEKGKFLLKDVPNLHKFSNYTKLFLSDIVLDGYKKTQSYVPSEKVKKKYPVVLIKQKYYIGALLKINDKFNENDLKIYDVLIGARIGNIISVKIPIENVIYLSEINGIDYIEIDVPAVPQLDQVRAFTFTNYVHQGYQLPKSYTGKNVIVGIIDIGFDFTHPVFWDTTYTRYRIQRLWDMGSSIGNPPAGYQYGTEIVGGDNVRNWLYDVQDKTHGTHVAGIAAGGFSGNPIHTYKGIAPEADLIIVSKRGSNSSFVDGIKYVFNYATTVNKPAVVNLSWGSHVGPHDGTSLFDQAVDSLVGTGKIVVGSAGNWGSDAIHLSKTLTSTDTLLYSFVEFPYLSGKTNGRAIIDIWGSPNTSFKVFTAIYNINSNSFEDYTLYISSNHRGVYIDTLYDKDPLFPDRCIVEISAIDKSPLNNKPNIKIYVDNTDQDDNYRYVLIGIIGRNTTVHAWANSTPDSFAIFVDKGYAYPVKSGNTDYTVGEIGGTGKSIISVGAFTTKNIYTDFRSRTQFIPYFTLIGEIAPFSSKGPTVDGRIKPDITAPGNVVVSAVSRFDSQFDSNSPLVVSGLTDGTNTWWFAALQGTSMSAPVVTGIIALMLSANPQLSPSQIKGIFQTTSITDNYTGITPNNTWGWGKVNAYSAIRKIVVSVTEENILPKSYALNQNYPNPFNPTTTIEFDIPEKTNVKLVVYDILGREVETLIDKELEPGKYKLNFTATNLPSGVYFYTLKTPKFTKTNKMLLIK